MIPKPILRGLPARKLQLVLIASLLAVAGFTQPTISSFSPTSAAVGGTITITGTNFSAVITNNHVVIGGVKATITSASSTSLAVTVPAGIVSNAPISVLNKTTHLWAISTQVFKPAFTPNKPPLITADVSLQGVPNSDDPKGLYGFAAADFDDDGKLDIIFSDGATDTKSVYVRRNISTTSVAFASAITITESSLLQAGKLLAIADLDGDAKLDVIVPGTQSNNVAILRNTTVGATISFTSTVESSGLSGTYATVAADFDGDGKIDIASAANGIHQLIVSTNTSPGPGTITFNPTTLSLGSTDFFSLAVADIDGDGKPDIIGLTSANDLEVYRNTSTPGSMSFVLTTVSSVITNAFGMVAGDIDGDTKPDIIINSNASSPYVNQFATLRNTSTVGSISFSQVNVSLDPSPAAGYSQDYPALADINGDGKLDYIVCLNYANVPVANRIHRVAVFNNTSSTGSISFSSEYLSYSTGNFLNIHGTVLAADFSGDGKPDIMAALNSHARFAIFTNTLQFAPTISSIAPLTIAPNGNVVITGTGFNSTTTNNIVTFGGITGTVSAASTTSLTVKVPLNASYAPISVLNNGNTLAGLSGDRFLPAFTPNKSALATTDFVQQANFSTTGDLYGLAAGDLTGDGKPELVVTNYTGNSLLIYPNTSTTAGIVSFGAPTAFTPTTNFTSPRNISLADIDGNGWLDVVVPSYSLSQVGVFLNSGTGVLSTALTLTGSFATGMGPTGVATGDLDGDGKPDIVTANNGASSVSIFRNTSIDVNAVSFDAKQDYQVSAGEAIFSVSLADLDNDGKLDIIASRDINSQYGKVVLLRNTSTIGNISFTTTGAGDVNGPKAPWSFIPGDLNGDGLTDFVASAAGSGATEIFAYTKLASGGALTNLSIIQLDVTTGNRAIGLADLNGDGKPDLISGTSASIPGYRTYIYPNTSTGTTTSFGTRIALPASALPWSTVITDMNADGKPDIVMGNQLSGGSTIAIYRNTLIAQPITQASGITVTSLTGTTATFSWTGGSGSKRALFIKADNIGSAAPATATDYTANTAFGSGSQIGSTGWYCVYNGTGNLVNVTGFSPSTSYRAMVTEFNDGGLSNTAQYNTNTATNNPVTITTSATVTAISRTTASATINTATADFRVGFNANMTGLTASNFSIATTGITGASITAVTGSGTVFTVTANTGTGDGTIGLNLVNTTGMVPGITNTLAYTGEVYTIDKTVPTLSPVTIISSNSNNSKAKTGDLITLSFTSSETINTPVVTLAGHTVAATTTGSNNWTASYTMTGTDTEGSLTFNIAFSDLNGNTGTAVAATTNSSSVVFDRTAPTLSTVTIATNNSNTALAKQGNTVTISFTTSETINTPTVSIATHSVTANNSGGNNWTATYTMTGSDIEGSIPFSISFSDIAGNNGTTVTATTNSSAASFDRTTPTLSSAGIGSNNSTASLAKTGDLITVNFSSNETITPSVTIATHSVTPVNTTGNVWAASYTMTGTDTEGNIPFSIAFTDIAGNNGATVSSTTNSSSVIFDRTSPTLSNVSIASNNVNNARAKTGDIITLSFTTSETISNPTVSIATNTATLTNTGNNWKATYTMTGTNTEGVIPFNISFKDLAGNNGTATSATTNSSSVTFDRTLPVLTPVTISSSNSNKGYAKPGDTVFVAFTSSEQINIPVVTISGAAVLTNTGNNWTGYSILSTTDVEGVVPFTITASDLSANASAVITTTTNSGKVIFDKTTPTLTSVSITAANANPAIAKPGTVVTLSFTASELLTKPVVTIAGHPVQPSGTVANKWSVDYATQNSDPEGDITFSISYSDSAGNAGTARTTTTDNSKVTFVKTKQYFTGGTGQTAQVCANAPLSINALLALMDSTSGNTVTWQIATLPAHGTLSGFTTTAVSAGKVLTPTGLIYTPANNYSGTDVFTVKVTDSVATTITVTVNALPSGTITTTTTTLCAGSTLTLTASGGNSYKWFKDGVQINGNSGSQLSVTTPGIYTATLVTAAGCEAQASNSVSINLVQQPKADFIPDVYNCINIPLLFTNASIVTNSGAVNYLWSDSRGITSTATSPSFTFTQAGNYTVKLKVTPQVCPALADSITKALSLVDAAAPQRLPTMDVVLNTPTQLQARVIPNVTYAWSPTTFLLSSNIAGPVTIAKAEQLYTIAMKAPSGCVTTDTLLVRVQPTAGGFLPNVFTPNNDGQNDKLMPNLVNIKSLRFFRIFNRWGKMLFETTNIGQGWDGKYNGVLQPMDTYTWVIEGYDGSGTLVKKQGSVTLLR